MRSSPALPCSDASTIDVSLRTRWARDRDADMPIALTLEKPSCAARSFAFLCSSARRSSMRSESRSTTLRTRTASRACRRSGGGSDRSAGAEGGAGTGLTRDADGSGTMPVAAVCRCDVRARILDASECMSSFCFRRLQGAPQRCSNQAHERSRARQRDGHAQYQTHTKRATTRHATRRPRTSKTCALQSHSGAAHPAPLPSCRSPWCCHPRHRRRRRLQPRQRRHQRATPSGLTGLVCSSRPPSCRPSFPSSHASLHASLSMN